MRAITSTTRTAHTLRTACVAATALMLGLSVLAVAEQQLSAPAPSTVVADGPIVTDPQEEWNSRG
ncbi:hypothetical protein OG462_07715 [Streptomyces sp. NBC_01077]|uniref:hypothetical protein n=1 Tax=unclassified Streptomyces TaxID=2593676 RepID=UPI0035DEB7AC|nr:hypothetical protein OG462_07715 [Streptomyces sp. NBC_01077]